MVLMPRPYKEDKKIERDLNKGAATVVKRPCTFDPQRRHEQMKRLSFNISKKDFLERMLKQEAQIKFLMNELEKIKANSQPKIVVVEEISKEEGKNLIEEYFKEHGSADIEDLMLNLRIPIQTVVEIIDELREEGKLVPKGE
ncbi:MAG: hypothetical protein NWF04_07685 [Candidatus Bathyarchaeota archaeon]|nr:hypothetical protein [Candidatus Bathyarchaeota archaeon]